MANELSAVAELLRSQEPEQDAPEGATEQEVQENEDSPSASEADDSQQSDAEEAPVEGPESYSVKDLAEKLGIRPQDVYSKLKIDVDGESLSLGEYKDRAKDIRRHDTLIAEAEDRRAQVENELQRARTEFELAQQLPHLPPEQREQQYRQYVDSETRKAVESIQGWDDPGTRTQELTEISALLTDYGLSPAQQGRIVDSTTLRVLADYNRLKKRLKAATESTVKGPKRQQGQRNRSASTKTPSSRAVEGYKSGKVPQMDAIAALIADGVKKNG